jgi:hypothetical protein
MFHIAAAPPCAWGFVRSLREAPLQRFHSIIIGTRFPQIVALDLGSQLC